jgi:hypothetical protein
MDPRGLPSVVAVQGHGNLYKQQASQLYQVTHTLVTQHLPRLLSRCQRAQLQAITFSSLITQVLGLQTI